MTDRDILLKLIGSLTLADHMGDVAEDVQRALELAKIEISWSDWDDLALQLSELGITTLYETSLVCRR
jgi:hypothetical protein